MLSEKLIEGQLQEVFSLQDFECFLALSHFCACFLKCTAGLGAALGLEDALALAGTQATRDRACSQPSTLPLPPLKLQQAREPSLCLARRHIEHPLDTSALVFTLLREDPRY